jgi:DNA-binding GntR family transcriptional regulator
MEHRSRAKSRLSGLAADDESPGNTAETAGAAGPRSPRYLEVARALIESINHGTYPVGTQLPTEMELGASFGTSRHTIREAIRLLDSQGMVSRRQGVGTIVTALFSQARYSASMSSLSDLLQHIDATELKFEADNEIAADATLAELLDCPVGQRWLRLDAMRVLKGSGEPVSLTQLYIHLRFAGMRQMLGATQNSVYALIEKHYHIRIAECRQDITPIVISSGEAHTLGVAPGTPGLHITRHYLDDQMKILAVSINRYPKDRFRFLMRWKLS